VLLNLLTNGIKYNNPGGSVELALWLSSDDEVTFTVRDDGIGMAEDDISRVTERFYRVDKSRSRERGGTGLGLAIVKHIVEAHQSRLQIQSRPGHGSTFSFALPVAPDANPPNQDTADTS
jgi:two-component system phosphate regulon sensor histidine kinase PhoR